MTEHRGSIGMPFKCQIRIEHPEQGELLVTSRDISDKGVYVLAPGTVGLDVGVRVRGQVQGMAEEAPILEMEVVRVDQTGVGLRFCQ